MATTTMSLTSIWNDVRPGGNIARQVVNEAGAANLPGKENGPYDAYRHALLAAELTRRYGETLARGILTAHELENIFLDRQGIAPSVVDFGNNESGIETGKRSISWDEVVSNTRQKLSDSVSGTGESKSDAPLNWMPQDQWSEQGRIDQRPLEERNWPTNPEYSDGPEWPPSPEGLPPDIPSPPPGNFGASSGWEGAILEGLLGIGRKLGDLLGPLDDFIHDLFGQARRWRPRSGDPLALDLDGDGIETVSADQGILFDHDGDGTKHGSGWVRADDGLLVLDKNGNGFIDNGSELFGVDTVKANGSKASDGFDALRDLDTNADGLFDINDADYANVRVWRDLNQDGISQATELKTLADTGIASIGLNAVAASTNLWNGNRLTHTALYTKTDGSTGTAANLVPDANPFFREHGDSIALTEEARALPSMRGAGAVRDLREAAVGSSELSGALTAYAAAPTKAAQLSLLDSVVEAWADSSSFKTSVEQAASQGITLVYLAPGQSITDYEAANRIGTAGDNFHLLSTEQQTRILNLEVQRRALVERITLLETFNGQLFVTVTPDNRVLTGTGAAVSIFAGTAPRGAGGTVSVVIQHFAHVSINAAQIGLLDQSYAALKQSVYDSLVTQTRLKPYLEAINLTLTGAGEIALDFSGIQTRYEAHKATDPRNALIDLIELQRYSGSALGGMGFNIGEIGLADMTAWRDDVEIKALLTAANVRFDDSTNGYVRDGYYTDDTLIARESGSSLSASGGNDALFGGSGGDNLNGGQGDDRLYGGAGNDYLTGWAGSDTYVFDRGFGQDYLSNTHWDWRYDAKDDVDRIQFVGAIRPDEVRLERVSSGSWDPQLSNLHISVGDDRIVVNRFFAKDGDDPHRVDEIRFADGTVWTESDILLKVLEPTSGDDRRVGYGSADIIYGGAGNDRLEGRGGNDTLYGGDGDDVLDGGDGDDMLDGGTGNDTLYGRAGDDNLLGGDGGDILYGNEGIDTLLGDNGDDILHGGGGDDALDGGAGNDQLYGGNGTWNGIGNDTYVFGLGYGHDTVFDYDATPGNVDTVRLNADVALGNVQLKRVGADLILALAGTDDSLTIKNWFSEAAEGVLLTQYRVERIEFADGTVWDTTEILRRSLIGTDVNDTLRGYITDDVLAGNAGHDSLLGLAGNDDLNGGTGDDVLEGGAGNDTYRFGRGYGRDVAVEQASWTTQGNRVVLNADVMPVDVVVRKVGNDLTLAIKGTTDMLTLRDAAVYAEGSAFGSVEFSDGTTWNYEALKSLAIAGTDGNDRIEGFDGPAEVFDGGAGNDVIEGGTGADTYMFGRGDGQDVIMDWDWNSGNIDTLEFKVGVLPSDVLLTREGQDLVARIADTGDQTTIKGWFDPYSYTVIERIRFADGTSWDVNTVRALVGMTPDEAYLFGTPGPDTLIGGEADNFIFGQEGDDLLSGGDGNDTLEGGDGDDTLQGGTGVDTLNGGPGLDHLNGGAGDDTLHAGGDLGNTYVIEQGGGFDTIKVAPVWSGVGEDVLRFGPGITLANLKVQITESNDGGYGGGEDGGYGGVAAFAFIGEDGIDRGPIFSNRLALAIGTGTNEGALLEMYGDGGIYTPIDFGVRRFVFDDGTELSLNDILALADGGVIGEQFGTAGDDSWLLGSVANDTVLGLGGNDRIETRDNEDAVFGNDGDDAISAGSGDDEVYGDDGDDVIAGGQGYDIVDGGNGTDVYVFNRGDGEDRLGAADDDTISFGVGILPEDVFVYRNLDGDLVLRLNDGVDGTLTVYGGLPKAGDEVSHLPIQRVQFIDADGHTRIFDFASALISHTARLNVSDGINPVQLLAAPGFEITGLETVAGGDYAVAYAQTGNLFGTPFYATPVVPGMGNDLLTGTTGQNTLDAGDGNDVVNAGAGDDVVLGGAGNDLLEGASGNDILNGGSGDDRLFGGSGNDILQGGGGNDLASGGAGDDTYVFNMGDGELTIMEAANWSGENRLRFGPGVSSEALKLSHDAGYLVIHSNTPGDVIRVEGFDRQDALGERAVAWSEFADGTVLSYDDLLARGFDIEGTPVEDLLQGTNLADRITGYDGADILEGGWGADVLAGGAGADEYIFNLGDGADVLIDGNEVHEATTLKFGAGVVPGSIYLTHENGSYVLRYGDGGDSIRFAGANVSAPFSLLTFADGTSLDFAALSTVGLDITGTINPDSLVGTVGADRVNGLASDDTLSGGDGFDIYTVAADGGFDTIIDQVNPGEENLVVFSGPAFTLDQLRLVSTGQPGLLTLEVAGETRGVRLSGFDPANALSAGAVGFFQLGDGGPVHSYAELAALGFNVVGTAEDDVLQGTAVFDLISGGAGNDHLQGGPGNDVAEGGAGDDHYYYNMGDGLLSIRDEISLAAENTLHFGPGITLDNIRNNLRFEAPEGGSPGALIINVDADGNGIRIEGFNPDDAATGVHAVEYYVFADGTVLSYAELVSNTFVIQGDGADNLLTGTNISDRLYGYAGSDTLIGGAGSDTLTGGPGADLLEGGEGDDVYVFNRGDGLDTITDSGAGFNALFFGPDILPEDIAYAWEGSTLVLNYGPGDAVRIPDFDLSGAGDSQIVRTMEFDDGTILSLTELLNRAPTIGEAIAAPMAIEDSEYLFTVPDGAFSDMDVGDRLSYLPTLADGSALPSWLNFNPSTRTFSGTPDNAQAGNLDILLVARDIYGLSANQTFRLEVINVNDAPLVANPIPPQTLLEDTSFSYTVPNDVFVDVDTGDSLTYSAILTDGTPLPAWLAFDAGTRTLSGTPGNAEVGSLAISITATDLSGTSASTILALNIANTNDAPVVINPIPAQTLLEDEAFTYTVPDNVFADIDIDDSLAYSATLTDGSVLPSWLSFDATTRTFSGLPANGDVGSLAISVTATDPTGASVATAFDLRVLNVNDAPIVGGTPLPALTLLEDETFSYTLPENTFLDVDAGDSLSYSATLTDGSALPSWLSFDATTRTFSGIPANGDVGSLAISVTATDLVGASVATAFDLSVLNVNDAPVVSTPIVDQSAKQGQAYLYTLPANTFTDPDVGDSLSYEVSLENGDPLPAWLSFDATTLTFSGTPGGGDVGNFGVKVTASDQAGAQVADSFTFSVSPGYNEINGTAGWDFLIGTAGNDRIDGKANADFMAGLGGDDLYIVDSWDFVLEFAGGGVDTVEASVRYQLPWYVENLSLTGSGAINGTGNFMNNVLIGNSAANTLTGLGGDDILIGGKGNDRLIGGTGNDLYLIGRGDGADTIVDYDRTSGNSDTLRFGADISAEQLWFSRTGNDLSVSVIGSQDTVSISNWYLGTANHVERIEAGNGQVVLDSQVQNLVNAMAAFAPPAAGQTSLPTDYQASLAPVIAANWQ